MAARIQASRPGVLNQSGYNGEEEQLDSLSTVKVKISGVNKGLPVGSERVKKLLCFFFVLKNQKDEVINK